MKCLFVTKSEDFLLEMKISCMTKIRLERVFRVIVFERKVRKGSPFSHDRILRVISIPTRMECKHPHLTAECRAEIFVKVIVYAIDTSIEARFVNIEKSIRHEIRECISEIRVGIHLVEGCGLSNKIAGSHTVGIFATLGCNVSTLTLLRMFLLALVFHSMS